jgi:hypothetical protein
MKWGKIYFKSIAAIYLLFFSTIIEAQPIVKRLLVYDQLYPNYVELSAQKGETDDVLIIPLSGNPLDYISESLNGKGFDEVHIYALSKPNALVFNALAFTANNINVYGQNLEKWKENLKPSTKIIIHSDVLDGDNDGVQLINAFHVYTDCEVLTKL